MGRRLTLTFAFFAVLSATAAPAFAINQLQCMYRCGQISGSTLSQCMDVCGYTTQAN